MRTTLAALCLLAACVRLPPPSHVPRPHVYLVVVDGLDPRAATPAHLPALFALLDAEAERSSFFPAVRAPMPARTNPSHATLLTGVEPEVHGITGNAYWSRLREAPAEKLDAAALLEVETVVTVAETSAPELATLAAFGKPKLARLFGAAPGRQLAPDVLWSPEALPPARRDPATGYASDAETVNAAVAAMAEAEPDLAILNLADVDRSGHARGPESDEYERAVASADAAIAALVATLRERGWWDRSVLVVTADHGMASVAPTPERPVPVLSLSRMLVMAGVRGVRAVADGGVEHIYAEDLAPAARDAGAAAAPLAEAAVLAAATTGVREVLARLPVPGVPPLAAVHPDWHLAHPRTGELLLVAEPGYTFVDPYDPVDAGLLGNHGGPGERMVPLVVTGGWPGLRAAPADLTPPALVDVAPTIAAVLGLRPPRRLDGSAVPADRAGRPIAAVLAQSPH